MTKLWNFDFISDFVYINNSSLYFMTAVAFKILKYGSGLVLLLTVLLLVVHKPALVT